MFYFLKTYWFLKHFKKNSTKALFLAVGTFLFFNSDEPRKKFNKNMEPTVFLSHILLKQNMRQPPVREYGPSYNKSANFSIRKIGNDSNLKVI